MSVFGTCDFSVTGNVLRLEYEKPFYHYRDWYGNTATPTINCMGRCYNCDTTSVKVVYFIPHILTTRRSLCENCNDILVRVFDYHDDKFDVTLQEFLYNDTFYKQAIDSARAIHVRKIVAVSRAICGDVCRIITRIYCANIFNAGKFVR